MLECDSIDVTDPRDSKILSFGVGAGGGGLESCSIAPLSSKVPRT